MMEKQPSANQIGKNPQASDSQQPFYVVSKNKFILLCASTLGIYEFYWLWKQWQSWKQYKNADVWAIPRAIFAIFFTHSLFNKINEEANSTGSVYPSLALPATAYISTLLANYIITRAFPDTTIVFDVLTLILYTLIGTWAIWQAQKQANIVCKDREGQSNSKLTVVNYLFIILGSALWLMLLLAAGAEYTGII